MNIYKRSFKKFKKIVRKNPEITREEWDNYAMQNILYSSITLEAHTDTYSFADLKKIYLEKFLGLYMY